MTAPERDDIETNEIARAWRNPRHLTGMVAECLELVTDRLNIEIDVNDESLALMKAFAEGTIWPAAENLYNLSQQLDDEIIAVGGLRPNNYDANLQHALEAFGIEVGVDTLGGERWGPSVDGAKSARDVVLQYAAGIVGPNPVALVCARWLVRTLSQDRPLDDDTRDAAIAAWMAGEFELVADLVCICDELRKRFDADFALSRWESS